MKPAGVAPPPRYPRHMDWSVLGTLAGTLLGGGGVVLKGRWDRRWAKAEKDEERALARDEAHRRELLEAYVAFMSATSTALDKAAELGMRFARRRFLSTAVARAFETSQNTEMQKKNYDDFVLEQSDNEARIRETVVEFTHAETAAATTGAALHLLASGELPSEVDSLADGLLMPPNGPDDVQRFVQDIALRRVQLKSLRTALRGAFSPERWASPVVKALTPQLERGAITEKSAGDQTAEAQRFRV